ncbi:MAG TPA: hypothetical protein VND44_05510 [Acidimicrobiales bacterium]|nr:hypothetical protein [Acidimicrobiales bacterium]
MRKHRSTLALVGVVVATTVGAGLTLVTGAPPAAAATSGPGVGTPYVASLGDSYISGEAGRWAGNTNQSSSEIDALGPTAYFDNATDTAEQIPGCHRSKSAEVHIGGGVGSVNLACSGAKTSTFFDSSGNFKPGIDFYSDSSGRQGQALMLQNFAATHNVKMVMLSIGGNNFNFAGIVQTCVEDWLLSPSWWPDYCSTDSSVTNNFSSSNIATQVAAIRGAIDHIRTAMADDGYTTAMYTIVVQDYPSPIPNGSGFRYSQDGYTRQSVGGCGFWNTDANWANGTALPDINGAVKTAVATDGASNLRVMDISGAFNGHRLCENTVGLLEEEGLTSWTNPGAVNVSEWINQIRTVTTLFGPYQIQESLHPDYWGQLALRDCARQAFNGGVPRGGTCTISGSGLDAQGEPVMTLH